MSYDHGRTYSVLEEGIKLDIMENFSPLVQTSRVEEMEEVGRSVGMLSVKNVGGGQTMFFSSKFEQDF